MAYSNYQRWKTTPISDTAAPYLSVIIPAYNEAERIVPSIGAIASHICDLGFDWELIIADDGSKDETVALVEGLGLVNARVLKAPKNGGKGSAVKRGMLAARGKYRLFADADNSTPIEEVTRLLAKIDGSQTPRYDIAIGSRAAEGAQESNKSLLRRIFSGGLRMMVKYVLGINVRDTQCGFKLYTAEAAERLHKAQTMMGFSFDLEVLYLAAKYGYKVAEVAVAWVDAPGSKVNPTKEAKRFIKDMAAIKRNDWRGAYAA
ncbi:MAG: glycosyltransferase family 2 protein [Anaerolineae bacterium]|nr:glycosyltransferase family 2 protein [Anaerolineae bacterium]